MNRPLGLGLLLVALVAAGLFVSGRGSTPTLHNSDLDRTATVVEGESLRAEPSLSVHPSLDHNLVHGPGRREVEGRFRVEGEMEGSWDGVLLCHVLGPEGRYLVEFEFRDHVGSFAGHAWSELEKVAAVVDGVPTRIVSDSDPGVVRVTPSPDHLVVVRATDGGPVTQSFVAELPFNIPPTDVAALLPPVVVSGYDVAGRGEHSVIWVPPTEWRMWYRVGAKETRHRALDLPPAPAVRRTVEVSIGSDARILLPAGSRPSNVAVRVIQTDDDAHELTSLVAERFTIRGLESGLTRFELCSLTDLGGAPLRSVDADLVAGATTLVDFGGTERKGPESGWLAGTVALPENCPEALRLDKLRLAIVQVVRGDGSAVERSEPIRLPLDSLTALVAGQRFAWDAGEIGPGGYRVELEYLGVAENVWVHPQQATKIDVVVPPLSEQRIFFLDELTGEPLDVSVPMCQYVEPFESHGTLVRKRARCYFDERSKCVVFLGVPGSIVINVSGRLCGGFWHETDVEAGTTRRNVTVPRASWVDLKFVRDPADPSSGTRWFGEVEVSSGDEWAAPIWFEWRLADEGRASVLSFCVRHSFPLDVRFEGEEGSPLIAAVRVPAATADPSEPGSFLRREVLVRVDG
jgi:hypothetical protein